MRNGILRTRASVRGLCMLALAAAVSSIAALPLSAQRYQYSHGGNANPGEEGNATIEAANGDHITAGSSNSLSNPTDPMSYIVRTDAAGTYIWDRVFKIGPTGVSVVNDITEDVASGDLILVGYQDLMPGRRGFVMRIDANANTILWIVSTSANALDLEYRSVVIAQQGDYTTTFPGDIIVAGTVDLAINNTTDGVLTRLDANGNTVWTQAYDVWSGANGCDDEFNGVDESRASDIGEIVAVGKTRDAVAGIRDDVWLLRVDGTTGTFVQPIQGSSRFGTPAARETGYSIRELHVGAHPGHLAIVGRSDGRPFPSSNWESFVMQTLPNPCDANAPLAAVYFGDNGVRDEGARSVREITNPAVETMGNLIVAGYTYAGPFGGSDAYLQVLQQGTLALLGPLSVYGGVGDEIARSVTETQFAPTSRGYVFGGTTTSPALMAPGNQQNVYVVKTNGALSSGCSDGTMHVSDAATGWTPECLDVKWVSLAPLVLDKGDWSIPGWSNRICMSLARPGTPDKGGNDGAASVDMTDNVATGLVFAPNPVTRGGDVAVCFTLREVAHAVVTVNDVMGREVYREASDHSAGNVSTTIRTSGWSVGTYMVKVAVPGHTMMTRMVVIDK